MSYIPKNFSQEAKCRDALARRLHRGLMLGELAMATAWADKFLSVQLEKAMNQWFGLGNDLDVDWSDKTLWDAELDRRMRTFEAQGIDRATSRGQMPQVLGELSLAMAAIERAANEYLFAAEKRHLSADRAEKWAADFGSVRADLAKARECVTAYREEWLAFRDSKEKEAANAK